MKKVIALRVTMEGPDIGPFLEFLQAMDARSQMLQDAVRQALILGTLRNIRKRFLANLDKASRVYRMMNSDGSSTKQFMEGQAASQRSRARLAAAYERLDNAMLQGDKSAAASARKRLKQVEAGAIASALGVRDSSKLSEARANRVRARLTARGKMSLGTLLNGVMKQRQLQVLSLLTSPTQIVMQVNAHSVTASIGNVKALDAVQTPSAVVTLRGKGTRSPHRSLWRQLEFGAGALRSRTSWSMPRKTRNAIVGGGWFFGPLAKSIRTVGIENAENIGRKGGSSGSEFSNYGLKIRGIEPMRFLFASGEAPWIQDAEDSLAAFDAAIRKHAPTS